VIPAGWHATLRFSVTALRPQSFAADPLTPIESLSRAPPPQLQKSLEPQEGAAAAARAQIAAQERELLASHSALLAARRAAGEKEVALRALKGEAWGLKQLVARQRQLLDAFAGELFQVGGLSISCKRRCVYVCVLGQVM
jgi:hypothetical protein